MKKDRLELTQLFTEFLNYRSFNVFAVIKGAMGIGKSLFLRKWLYEIQEKKEGNIKLFSYKYGESLQILVSSLNVATKPLKMNGFRPILKKLLSHYCLRNKVDYSAMAEE